MPANASCRPLSRLRRPLLRAAAAAACLLGWAAAGAQINIDQVMRIGQNTLYFDDYVLSIQYFNRAIASKPWLAQPWFLRSVAKLNLDDYSGAEADATAAIERNPFITDAYEVRGVARQNLGRLREAVADYDAVLEQFPDARGPLFNKAMALQGLREYAGADTILTRLTRLYPAFDAAWTGRSRLRLLQADTLGARADAEQALRINSSSVNARLLRADILLTADDDAAAALADMDEAVRAEPRNAALYINRAFVRYRLDDIHGAMADYDYALTLDPVNTTALTNRALLRAEVRDTNRAVDDLNAALALDPADHRALFNRALLLRELGDLEGSLADIDRLLEAYPDFAAAWFLRYEVKSLRGDRDADADRRRSFELADAPLPRPFAAPSPADLAGDGPDGDQTHTLTQEEARRQFTSLLTVAGMSADEVYDNPDIKGRVQDRDVAVELEPVFVLSYYIPSTELKPTGDYLRQVSELNEMCLLPMALQVSNRAAAMTTDEATFQAHTASIARLSAQMASRPQERAIDYFARAMDHFTIRDYTAAEADFARAAELTPDFVLARLGLFMARYMAGRSAPAAEAPVRRQAALAAIDEVIRLAPGMAIAWFDKGVVLAEAEDYAGAVDAFARAIELRPDFGEAFYNRGYAQLRLGRRDAGVADLSTAGQLGVVPSYNLLKRLSR